MKSQKKDHWARKFFFSSYDWYKTLDFVIFFVLAFILARWAIQSERNLNATIAILVISTIVIYEVWRRHSNKIYAQAERALEKEEVEKGKKQALQWQWMMASYILFAFSIFSLIWVLVKWDEFSKLSELGWYFLPGTVATFVIGLLLAIIARIKAFEVK